jgi:hypothetical protein
LTTACGKDVFNLGRNLLPLLRNSNDSSKLDDFISASTDIIKNFCTKSCSPAISEFFVSVKDNQECRNTTLAVTKIGNPTAYQLASVLAVGNALVCTNNSSCIMDEIATARKVIADHPPTELGSHLFALLGNRSFVCNDCTKQQSLAVQSIPIKDLDIELKENMEFFVDRLEMKCSSPDGFADAIALSNSTARSDTVQNQPITNASMSFSSINSLFIMIMTLTLFFYCN